MAALRLRYEDLRRENERLRDARAGITSQLGPLPISAAIVAGLVSGFSVDGKAHLDKGLAIAALAVFLAMVVVSMLYSVLRPYRKLRDHALETAEPKPEEARSAGDWYAAMIKLEDGLRGKSPPPPKGLTERLGRMWPFPRAGELKTLQAGCDLEWKGLFLTKLLFVAVIALLILARVA